MEVKKLKMSNIAFGRIMRTLIVLVLVLCAALNAAASQMGSTISTYLGMGSVDSYIVGADGKYEGLYYEEKYSNSSEAKDAAYTVARKVANEGSILLKNNGILPLAEGSNVMPFGYAYLNPIYGQLSSGGSAKWVVDPVTPKDGLYAFNVDESTEKIMTESQVLELTEAEGTSPAGQAGSVLGGDCKIYEYDSVIYNGINIVSDTTGIVFVTRSGQEGQDQKFDAYSDGTPHYLALSENEKGAIRAAKEICGRVIVILVSSAPMEMSDLMQGELEADAILWMGHPGEKGFEVLSDLLDGNVNPSGRTVDIWTADFTKDPSYQSVGTYTYTNLTTNSGSLTDGGEFDTMYNEYMEDVYMGYRYYETAEIMDESFVYGSLDEKGAYTTRGAVCYPFGYGLSYTSFEKELLSVENKGDEIEATVKVTNTGTYAGKEVVQLYYSAPYTEFDVYNKIEKPAVNLGQFDKTKLLEPGESQTITLVVNWEDIASYCYIHENYNGTVGAYVLEEGEYIISLRNNSHDVVDEAIVNYPETVWFDGSDTKHTRSTDETVASNQFQLSSDYMNTDSTLLSRANWNETQPQGEADHEKAISDKYLGEFGIESDFDPATDEIYGNVPGSLVYAQNAPVSNADNGLVLSDLRGADYDDERWDLLLDQIDWEADKEGVIQNFSGDAYTTAAIESIGLPATVDEDGANGLKVNALKADFSGYDMDESSSFGFAPLMAATWNLDLLYEVGQAFGQESLMHGISGWYAPAINLHRSMFSGRVFEYYSEDPVLSGYAAAAVISGAGDSGMYCYLKHFALNETETGRASLICTWADEQTMRELYLKAFEIAIKNAKMTLTYYDEAGELQAKEMNAATAVMATQTRVGNIAGECNYALLNNVLRDEWGFEGMVISDYWVWNGDNLRDLCVRTGCDTYLCLYMPSMWNVSDYDSPTARMAMRRAIKNICYTVVNSNAMQGVTPGAVKKQHMAGWKKILIVNDIIVGIFVVLAIVWIRKRKADERIHPENYKVKKKKVRK